MRQLLTFLLCLLPCVLLGQTPQSAPQDDPLAVTLPSGKTVHFPTAEAKAAFLAARDKAAKDALSARDKADKELRDRRDKNEAANQAARDEARLTREVWLEVENILPDGVLARFQWYDKAQGPDPDKYSPSWIFVACKPPATWVDNTILHATVVIDGTYEYTTAAGSRKRVESVVLKRTY